MKRIKIKILAYTLFVSFSLLGCSDKLDSFSPYYYTIKIRFTEKNGNDLVRGIDYIENSKAENNIYEVKKGLYELVVTQTGKPKEDLSLSPLFVQLTDSYDCVVLTTSTPPLPDYRPDRLTHTIVCSHIFGNDGEHIIESNWEAKNTTTNVCTSITVDGRTYTTKETDKNGIQIFIVTLN